MREATLAHSIVENYSFSKTYIIKKWTFLMAKNEMDQPTFESSAEITSVSGKAEGIRTKNAESHPRLQLGELLPH